MAVRLNAGRRQMSVVEKAQEAAAYAEANDVTIADAARVWCVAERHISRVRRVLAHNDPQLHQQMRDGVVSLGAAEERVANIEQERRREEDWKKREEEAKPVILDSDGMVSNRTRLKVVRAGADTDAVVAVVDHALRNGTTEVEIVAEFDEDMYYGDRADSVVAWSAPAKKQREWTWKNMTVYAIGCSEGWKKALPVWREKEVMVRVSRAAAKELGLSEGEYGREAVAAAYEKYDGSSVAVDRLASKVFV